MTRSFHEDFVDLFHRHFQRVYRVLDRISGEPDLAKDLTQEAFVKLYRRGSSPDRPEAWLVTVALNLLRNERSTRSRRARLLNAALESGDLFPRDGGPPWGGSEGPGRRVRGALAGMPERERRLLVLRAEGLSYRDLAEALDLNEASVGTLLSRAKQIFRDLYEGPEGAAKRAQGAEREGSDASR
jgi:RNA polymerase sigma-70 factor (ECF subfamily)